MRKAIIAVAWILMAASMPAVAEITVVYGTAKKATNAAWNAKLQESRFLERVAANFESIVQVPDMRMVTMECNESSAYWNPGVRQMALCLELLTTAEHLSQNATHDRRQRALLTGQLVQWVLAHELGHGLIDTLKLPALGREEDVADQIATVAMLHSKGDKYAVSGAMLFFSQLDGTPTWGTHGLNPQRMVNVACLAWGMNPQRYRYLERHIPPPRRERCGEEYKKLSSSLNTLMGDKLRINLTP